MLRISHTRVRFFALLLASLSSASAQITKVVNAASQQPGAFAPGTIVTIFGTNLANKTAVTPGTATPPTTVGGVTVTVGNVPAPIYFVSPTQINAVVSFSTPTGSQTLTVNTGSATFSQSVTIGDGQPGIFSLLGTGTGDGAIINPLTLAIGTFTVFSSPHDTYLSIFMTGLDTSTTPTITVGGTPVRVTFAGASPCCYGLDQVNVVLPATLSGAGRVPLTAQSGGEVSNTVEIVLLPPPGSGPFPTDEPDQPRSRELASIAAIPGTSNALLTDEDDDVVRVINVGTRKVTNVISLASGAHPNGIAISTDGATAVVAERGASKIAIVDVTHLKVTGEVTLSAGPLNVAIAGNLAVVTNGDAGSVSIVDLTSATVKNTLQVGAGARGVAVDATLHKAWVTNQDDGTISVIDLTSFTVTGTVTLGAEYRPGAIVRLTGSNFVAVAVPAGAFAGQVLMVNINDGTFTTLSTTPAVAFGVSDIAISGSTLFFADQTGDAITAVPISIATGKATGAATTVKVDLGARALAIDANDGLLLVVNEGSGTVVLVDIAKLTVVGRINGVESSVEGDDEGDDHSDQDNGGNVPLITSVSPSTAQSTSTFTLTIMGANLAGATGVIFVSPSSVHGNGKGQGKGDSPDKNADPAFTVSNIQVNSAGTTLTATISAAKADPGPRIVLVKTPNGETPWSLTSTNVLMIH
ncbi:MAG TPA: IPT/TIG domain-containing protein [Bryobacteraceae bacterium]|nr:IPT/TIG domain-containing protein [Bryobacteraceae bacterium]